MKRRKFPGNVIIAFFFLCLALGACTSDNDASRFAGTYRGSFAGDDQGTYTAVVDKAGNVAGSGVSNAVGSFIIRGTVNSNGSFQFTTGIATTGASFAGTIAADGKVSGTWSNANARGTFNGTR